MGPEVRDREPAIADSPRQQGRSDEPDSPSELDKRSWRDVLPRTIRECKEDALTDWAAALTFYGILSLFPGVLVLVSVLGLVGASATQPLLDNLSSVAPGPAKDIATSTLEGLQSGQGASGLLAIVGIAVAVWSASNYVGAFIRASNAIYEIGEGRPFWKVRPLQLAVTIAMVLLLAMCALAVVLTGPLAKSAGDIVGLGSTAVAVWNIAKWPVIAVIFMTMLALLYYAAPNVRHPRFRWITPGAVAAVLIWLVASAAFAFYVANFGSYNKTYGSLGGLIVFLVWLWISNIAVLLGAELNAETERGHQIERGMDPDVEPFVQPRDTRKLDTWARRGTTMPRMWKRMAGMVAVACLLAAPQGASALPGDAPFGQLAPADGATLPVDPDGIAVSFSCPVYRVADDGFIPVFGGVSEYGVSLSASPAVGADGLLAGGTRNTATRDPVAPDACISGLGAGGPPPRIQETPGVYYWQVYRICTGCPGSYEASPLRRLTLASPVKPALTAPATAFDGYAFVVSVAVAGAPAGTGVAIERKSGSGWSKVASASTASGRAEAVVTLARGQRTLRAVVTIGSQRVESPARAVNVKRARNWTTTSRSNGRYKGSGSGLKSVSFRVAAKGRELRDFDAKVPMLCPGIVAGQFTTQVGAAKLRKVKIAPDGRFVGAAIPVGGTAIRVRGRLAGRNVSDGRVELSVGNCAGSQAFTARRSSG